MAIGLRLELRQTQQLVMTPQLQQAIRLLAMSNLELREFLEEQALENPLLVLAEPEGGGDDRPEPGPAADPETPADRRTEDHSLSGDVFDTGAENLHDPSPSDGPSPLTEGWGAERRGPGVPTEGLGAAEERLSERPGLREHLREQLGRMSLGCPTTALFARYLVEELDEHGYLRGDLDEIAARLKVAPEIAGAALAAVQSCDPTGVGARDLAECLGLQLTERGPIEEEMRAFLDNLTLLERGELKRLRALCGVDQARFGEMIAALRRLNPRPCATFDRADVPTLVPDIIVSRAGWGGWKVELNAETLPRVLIDRTYRARVGGAAGGRETETYLADCHANATWLIKSLDQRARTVLKVAAEIVRRQGRFFDEGIAGLCPLTLRDVAEAVDLHESTVSRVTSNKFVATEAGIFELKFFFAGGLAGEAGDVSATTVRHRIKALVAAERATDVLSDDAIVATLRSEGVVIARRTVAKYRKSLNIPSSTDRRRRFALDAGL